MAEEEQDSDDSGESPSRVRSGSSVEPGAGTFPNRPLRPTFARLVVDSTSDEPVVEVTLTLGGRRLVGRAVGPATGDTSPPTAAAATLDAVADLLPAGMHTELGWLDVIDDPTGERPRYANSGVHCRNSRGTQTFLGSALASGDPRVAAVRATLDALNRPLLIWGGQAGTDAERA